jgi:hypothetical protein
MNVVEGEEQDPEETDKMDAPILDPTIAINAIKDKATNRKEKAKLTANPMEAVPRRVPATIVEKMATKQGNAGKDSMMKSRKQRKHTRTMHNILPSMKLL